MINNSFLGLRWFLFSRTTYKLDADKEKQCYIEFNEIVKREYEN